MSIIRKRKCDATNETIDFNKDYIKEIIGQLKTGFNAAISNEIEASLVDFLAVENQFNPKTSSVIAITVLKSQMCNYLSYFPNFQWVYHSKLNEAKSTQADDINYKLAKFDLYSVANPNLIFNESDDLVTIIDDILDGDAGI